MVMNYPGLPTTWGWIVAACVAAIVLWALTAPTPGTAGERHLAARWRLGRTPLVGKHLLRLTTRHWPLVVLRVIMVVLFLLIIAAGLFGSPIPQRNIATVFTWNIWWTGVIISVVLVGTVWCAVCPWDTLARWLVHHRLWRRPAPHTSLNLRVPRYLKNLWPALFLFIALTWLELGAGITVSPHATALLALFMIVLAVASQALFERSAFCRYFCPVGRTIGCYSQLAPVELRPIDRNTCERCETLDCYYGNEALPPCPTSLVMGRIQQNSYCISCGNCTQSCPQQNIDWQLRPPGVEAMRGSRPHWDEAWFMLGLLALTGFHGITMMPFWEKGISHLARMIGDSGQLLTSFSIGLAICMLAVIGLYALAVGATRFWTGAQLHYRHVFASLAFVCLPLAFAYHVAHNLNHLVRESAGISSVIANPFGTGTLPLCLAETSQRLNHLLIPQTMLHTIQASLIIVGFLLAVQILRHRLQRMAQPGRGHRTALLPMLLFAAVITGFHMWLLMQPMVMRM